MYNRIMNYNSDTPMRSIISIISINGIIINENFMMSFKKSFIYESDMNTFFI